MLFLLIGYDASSNMTKQTIGFIVVKQVYQEPLERLVLLVHLVSMAEMVSMVVEGSLEFKVLQDQKDPKDLLEKMV